MEEIIIGETQIIIGEPITPEPPPQPPLPLPEVSKEIELPLEPITVVPEQDLTQLYDRFDTAINRLDLIYTSMLFVVGCFIAFFVCKVFMEAIDRCMIR